MKTLSTTLKVILTAGWFVSASLVQAANLPNIVYILCDDLGYGDVKSNNPEGKLATPNMDKLAAAGMRFTDAHSSSSVCTPTRYGIMTGRYNWRSRLQNGVLGGLSPRLIEPGRLTAAALLKQHGYRTAVIGKWHLGMDWAEITGRPVPERNDIEKADQVWSVDYAKPIANGPTSVGFDYYFGISASLDMVPYTFIENDHVTVLPTATNSFPMTQGSPKGKTRVGPTAPGFTTEEVLPTLTRKACEYIGKQTADAKAGKPFYLYLPLNAPHTPIAPTPEWRGKSGISPYGDFVMETDWAIGEVLGALERGGIADNTLVFLTSDNGCSPAANIPELQAAGHEPNYIFRGHKADIWDGGHRIPFIVRWPAKIKAGSTCGETVCLVDFLATCAEILGVKLPADAGEDSVSLLPMLTGRADGPRHEAVVHHSINGRFSIRQGKWKLEFCPGSGGWSAPRDEQAAKQALPPVQLYDLEKDIRETTNVQAQHPDVVARLTKLLERYVAEGRSTPGPAQKNAVAVDIRKLPRAAAKE